MGKKEEKKEEERKRGDKLGLGCRIVACCRAREQPNRIEGWGKTDLDCEEGG